MCSVRDQVKRLAAKEQQGNFWGVMEMFYIVIVVVIMYLYTCVKMHRALKNDEFYCMQTKFSKDDF